MDRGLEIAASGMLTEMVRQDSIAGDLANASTPGYKPEVVSQSSFGDALNAAGATGHALDLVGYGAQISQTSVDVTQAPLESTGEPLDFALQGPGFLAVQTANGTLYTRDGQFAVDGKGQLVTASGDPVLSSAGKPIELGTHAADLKVTSTGAITAGGKSIGSLDVVSLTNPSKVGDDYFTGTPGAKPAETTVNQGSLEGSAVNPTTVMIDMIVSLRAYESSQRAIHSIDETLQRGIDGAGGVS
jgi:flagellar basal-body rod protein FlgG